MRLWTGLEELVDIVVAQLPVAAHVREVVYAAIFAAHPMATNVGKASPLLQAREGEIGNKSFSLNDSGLGSIGPFSVWQSTKRNSWQSSGVLSNDLNHL